VWCSGCARARLATRAGSGAAARCGQQAGMARQEISAVKRRTLA